ncbi:cation-translocating P-type ATPase [Luteimonas granuli]|uniref:Cation-translocating P-type ATPase n=1 Tax=Luteimonas granuli TaxID=1176533 RepID=A0A518N6R3_9GAMM|nr:cation-translocating P-type ATPase [Luteimonas granuli]QDW67615.1 cation-translocating P-type ATPase [Luteimonas granuli]
MDPIGTVAHPWSEAPDGLAARLGTRLDAGLSEAEAERRLAAHGPNELAAEPPVPAWRRFLARFRDPLVYLLLAAIAISAGAWLAEGAPGWPVDALVIAMIVLLNAGLGFVQEAKASSAVAELAKMSAVTSSVLRDGVVHRVPSRELVPGDVLLLAEGDAVGADARLAVATALRLQEASLTGESAPVTKDAAALPADTALAERRSMVFKGTAVAQGTGRALVTATGMGTEMGAIAGMLEATGDEPTPLQREVGRLGKVLGVAVVAVAVVVMATLFLFADIGSLGDAVTVLLLGVSLAVAAVPEGLPAILSVVLALGVQRMARRRAIVKRLASVETLGSASVICSDKTGTLTRSEMTIQRVATASGTSRVTGVGYVPEGEVLAADGELPPAQRAEGIVVLSGGSLAGNAQLSEDDEGGWEIQGDPTEAAFLVAERKLGVHERRGRRFERLREIPFSSERKMMSTIEVDHEHGGERVLIAKGAPDVLLRRCSHERVGMALVPLDEAARARILGEVAAMGRDALRTLGVAYRALAPGEEEAGDAELEQGLAYVGTVGIIDPPREEAAVAIAEARRAGIRVVMITGDHPDTAARIAADLGITAGSEECALTGRDLDALDDAGFDEAVRRVSVFARVAPAHKLRIVDALQAQGNVVAMTGDGVNDAPALKSADIGVAMGLTGTEVSKEAADMILADDNFATIVDAVREGRGIFDNIRKFLRYLLSSNMGEVLTVFLGVVLAGHIGLTGADGALVLPLLATQILWINLVTDAGPALAMGLDPADDDVMARPPRRLDERVIDGRMWSGVLQVGLVMAAATLLTLDIHLPGGLMEGSRDLDNARTAAFTTLVFAQLFNCFNARSGSASAVHALFTNAWLWGAVALSALLQVAVVHLGVLNTAFNTVPLDAGQWAGCIAMASSVLWYGELRKLVLRSVAAGRGGDAGRRGSAGAGA